MSYSYDDLGRVSEISMGSVPRVRYKYDGSSRIAELQNLVEKRKVVYEYDLLGREVKKSIFHTETGERLSCVRTRYDDAKNRISGYEVEAEGKITSYEYLYGENGAAPDAVTGVKTGTVRLIDREYDDLGRLSQSTLHTTLNVTTQYSYLPGSDNTKTTTLVGSVVQDGVTTTYAYDANGNITSIVEDNGVTSVTTSFTYDAKNQLASETKGNDTWAYTYDAGGNLLSVTKNNVAEKSYTYAVNTGWKDRLTKFNNANISYDAIGNATAWRDGMTFSWVNGRKLASVTQNNATTSFTYDGEGNRIGKTGADGTVTYTVLGGTILGETRTVGNTVTTLHYFFDESGTRIGFLYNNTPYYYRLNLQGDVTGIYNAAGTVVATYQYDAWGVVSVGGDNTTLGNLNPFRYRGYYYDTETELYYLNSRYYDPEVCRFINADSQLFTGDMTGMNLFSYCGNNPVNRTDSTGKAWWHWALGATIVAACAIATVVTCGGFAAAATAVGMVASGTAAATASATVAAGAFIGSATVYGMAVLSAASTSSSVQEFNDQGNWGTVASTAAGGIIGGINAYSMSKGQTSTSSSTGKGAQNPKVKAAIEKGQEMHRQMDYGPGVLKEKTIAPGCRVDGIDFGKRIIFELKPNNPQAIARGIRQLERYANAASQQFGGEWNVVLKLYD